ncbi:MAG: hypothetical protein HYY43_00815 [Deltaproteobacteria bacterium]|nr:hypothetical protein [Deltaproteobacteria bacterium]MBI2341460.1 hypothetical protein [Deltaproteobacteria bacterium]MBI2974126.1 hypothetical protein [Deltaproteobacteria bacterium]
MLINQHLLRLCRAILNNTVGNINFGNMLVEAGIKLDEKEWDIANKLLEKSEEISHVTGGKDKKMVH